MMPLDIDNNFKTTLDKDTMIFILKEDLENLDKILRLSNDMFEAKFSNTLYRAIEHFQILKSKIEKS